MIRFFRMLEALGKFIPSFFSDPSHPPELSFRSYFSPNYFVEPFLSMGVTDVVRLK